MTTLSKLSAATGALLLSSVSVFAQSVDEGRVSETIGVDPLNERIEDIEEDIDEDFERSEDRGRFGFGNIRQGFSGSTSLRFDASTGNTEDLDLTLAGRLRYGAGPYEHSFGFAAEYGEADIEGDGTDDNIQTEGDAFLTYDLTRSFNDRFYLFGLGRYQYDDFGPLKQDAFLGFGPGYRIFNTPQMAWRVQAGIGLRYTEDQITDDEETEEAIIASSRFYYAFNDDVFVTNDTDILNSDEGGTLVTNDLGLNYRLTDVITTRTSLRTEYDSEAEGDIESTDHSIGVSVIYSF